MSASIRSSVFLVAFAVLIVAVSGCGDSERTSTMPEPPRPDPEPSMADLIRYFAAAHEARQAETYADCLHPDFTFWFFEDDRSDPGWDWTDWIAKDEDLEVTEWMFEWETVDDVTMELTNLTVDGDTLNFYIGHAATETDTFAYYWAEFAVDLHVLEVESNATTDRWVDGRAHIYLRPDPVYEGLWTIWKIEDLGAPGRKGSTGTEVTSWSNLKERFRR